MSLDKLGILFKILNAVEGKLEQDELRRNLATALQKPIKNMYKSCNELIYVLYLLGGANIMGIFYEPLDPEKGADEIVNQFIKTFKKFLETSKELSKYLDTHLDDIKPLVDPKEYMILEAFIQSFKDGDFDIALLYNHGLFQEMVIDEYEREKRFPMLLANKLNEEMAKLPSLAYIQKSMAPKHEELLYFVSQLTSEMALTKLVDEDDNDSKEE